MTSQPPTAQRDSHSSGRPEREVRDELVGLSRRLARPEVDLVILAEGNTSARVNEDFLVKASGFSLGAADADAFVRLRTAAVLETIERPPSDAASWFDALLDCRTDEEAPRPSVEAPLHALAVGIAGARWVGHTHPIAVNSLLCSHHAPLLGSTLFPDQIVVCGRYPLFVPYVDPGLALAIETRRRLLDHIDRYGEAPRVILLENHGLVALGQSATEVEQITAMCVKTARILLGALQTGSPRFLDDRQAAGIDGRPDEHYRRRMLAAAASAARV
jgi:rhamnose utilization protein RhaD (predicted bifunctional aldolase and dehydrogenase)